MPKRIPLLSIFLSIYISLPLVAHSQQVIRISGIDNQTGHQKDSFDPKISRSGDCVIFESTANTNSCFDNGFGSTIYLYDRVENDVSVASLKEGRLQGISTAGGALSADCSVLTFNLLEVAGTPPLPSQVYWRENPRRLTLEAAPDAVEESLFIQTPICSSIAIGASKRFSVQAPGEISLVTSTGQADLSVSIMAMSLTGDLELIDEICPITDIPNETCEITQDHFDQGSVVATVISLVGAPSDFTLTLSGPLDEGYASFHNGEKSIGNTSSLGGINVSGDGRYVAFETSGDNLSILDNNGERDVYLHNTVSGETTLASVSLEGVAGNGASVNPRISADGSTLVFHSRSSDLEESFASATQHIYRKSLNSDSPIELVDQNTSGEVSQGIAVDSAVSGNGRFIAFQTSASNLAEVDTGQENVDIFIRDSEQMTTEIISLHARNDIDIFGNSNNPTISEDGRFVAFASAAQLLAIDINEYSDIYVRDRQHDLLILASVSTNGDLANAASFSPQLSGDGNWLVFESNASNLTDDDNNLVKDIFLTNLPELFAAAENTTTTVEGTNTGNGIDLSPMDVISGESEQIRSEGGSGQTSIIFLLMMLVANGIRFKKNTSCK